jgi:hypothetical protein
MKKKPISFAAAMALATSLVTASAIAETVNPKDCDGKTIYCNAPSWVVSDYVLWELLDYMNTGDQWIAYTAKGTLFRRHINVSEKEDGTHVYFNWERSVKNNIPAAAATANEPGSRGIGWPYYSYFKTPDSLRGFNSNGAASNANPLSLNMPLPFYFTGNSDDVLDYAKIGSHSQDVRIFKDYIEKKPTTLHLGMDFDPATSGPAGTIVDKPSVYVQLGELLADAASIQSKLSLIVYDGSTLMLTRPVNLRSLTLKGERSVLNLSEMSRQDLLNKMQAAITVENGATIMLPSGTSDAEIKSLTGKFPINGAPKWKVFPDLKN